MGMLNRLTVGSLLVFASISYKMAAQKTDHAPVFQNAEAGAKLMNGSLDMAIKMHKQMSKPGKNVFFSPASVGFAMAMTYAGGRSETATQMKAALGFSDIDDADIHASFADLHKSLMETGGNYSLSLANRLYGHQDYHFLPAFLEGSKKHYAADLQNVNFADDASRLAINKWVEDQTNDKITNLLADKLDPLTRLILVNAIYFKGEWANKFDPARTNKDEFTKTNGEKVPVDMMWIKKKFQVLDHRDLGCQILEMPYKGNILSMLILLPHKHDGLAKLEANLTPEAISGFPFGKPSRVNTEVYLPRFKLEESASLAETLRALGMQDAFIDSKADFSGMDGSRNLFLGDVVHKAFIEVNEEGSEAAAATAAIMMMRMAMISMPVRVDHPFLFLIRDNRSGSILFMGKVEEPSPAGTVKDEL